MRKKRILIIEDDSLIVRLYTTRLGMEGYDVISAVEGGTGWKKFNEKQPDLVILDLMLPKTSGIEILKKIRADNKKYQCWYTLFYPVETQ